MVAGAAQIAFQWKVFMSLRFEPSVFPRPRQRFQFQVFSRRRFESSVFSRVRSEPSVFGRVRHEFSFIRGFEWNLWVQALFEACV